MLKDNNESNDSVLSILLQFAQIIKCDSTIDSRTVYKAFVLQDIRTNQHISNILYDCVNFDRYD